MDAIRNSDSSTAASISKSITLAGSSHGHPNQHVLGTMHWLADCPGGYGWPEDESQTADSSQVLCPLSEGPAALRGVQDFLFNLGLLQGLTVSH